MKYNKHLEILPFVLNNYYLFDLVLVNTILKKIGSCYYIILQCDVQPKQINWLRYNLKNEPNFMNLNIDDFYEFMFKIPEKYQWYVPLVYNSGVKVIHPFHIHKFFVNKNTQDDENRLGYFVFNDLISLSNFLYIFVFL